jgi:hypothetical protein
MNIFIEPVLVILGIVAIVAFDIHPMIFLFPMGGYRKLKGKLKGSEPILFGTIVALTWRGGKNCGAAVLQRREKDSGTKRRKMTKATPAQQQALSRQQRRPPDRGRSD